VTHEQTKGNLIMNVNSLNTTAAATLAALEEVRSHTQKVLTRAHAALFFIAVHGFFEANPAVTSFKATIDAEGGLDEEGYAYTCFSTGEIAVEVSPDVSQQAVYGFADVHYDDLGNITLGGDILEEPVLNVDLVHAIEERIHDHDANTDWLTQELPHSVGNPGGRDFTFTVDRSQVGRVGDVLLQRLHDEHGSPVIPTSEQIQAAQDEVISWVVYQQLNQRCSEERLLSGGIRMKHHRYDCAVSIGHAILLRAAFLDAKRNNADGDVIDDFRLRSESCVDDAASDFHARHGYGAGTDRSLMETLPDWILPIWARKLEALRETSSNHPFDTSPQGWVI
jgi:hypothetical protein